jgi:hypothetical protein
MTRLGSLLAGSIVLVIGAIGLACGGDKVDARFPPRPEGCTVEVFHDIAPTRPSENIGTVNANCTDLVSDDDCLRTLKDQVCKLGGDIVWGVEPAPVIKNGRKLLSGRAAKAK